MTDAPADSRSCDWLSRTAEFSTGPGVYLMRDRAGAVIYVGKANNLRARVRSYFQPGRSDDRAFVFSLGEILLDIETIVTANEKEALLLERELIKKHEPRFNVIWRDDKQYLCLRIDERHPFPRVDVVRLPKKDGARYFGPFHNATSAREMLRLINRAFGLRTCTDSTLKSRSRPCLEYQMGRCPAPCVLDIDRDAYRQGVEDVILLLEGDTKGLYSRLESRMWKFADAKNYEAAARIRDQIAKVKRALLPQAVAFSSMRDEDVFGLHRDGLDLVIAIVEVRRGRVANIRTNIFSNPPMTDGEVLESLVLQEYASPDRAVPAEVVLPLVIESQKALCAILSEKTERRVKILSPRRGERFSVLKVAQRNAVHALEEAKNKGATIADALERLRKDLHLRARPVTMECLDISNLMGRHIVGSCVRFLNGVPDKKKYRHYRIRTKDSQDDFAAMYEVLLRRILRGQKEGDLPDLVVIDGGKGQLGSAKAALKDLGAESVEIIALAKSRRRSGRAQGNGARDERTPERVFLADAIEPIALSPRESSHRLLERIRDEAHRFAITFHRRVRDKAATRSVLDGVSGVGPARRRAILRHFGSMDRVRGATLEELLVVPGLGQRAAEAVHAALHPADSIDNARKNLDAGGGA